MIFSFVSRIAGAVFPSTRATSSGGAGSRSLELPPLDWIKGAHPWRSGRIAPSATAATASCRTILMVRPGRTRSASGMRRRQLRSSGQNPTLGIRNDGQPSTQPSRLGPMTRHPENGRSVETALVACHSPRPGEKAFLMSMFVADAASLMKDRHDAQAAAAALLVVSISISGQAAERDAFPRVSAPSPGNLESSSSPPGRTMKDRRNKR